MDDLIDRARPVMERYATPTQRVKFFGSITGRNLRRDRYVVSDETLGWSQAALAASRELGTVGLDLGGIGAALSSWSAFPTFGAGSSMKQKPTWKPL